VANAYDRFHGLGALWRSWLATRDHYRPRQAPRDKTIVHLSFETGGKDRRIAGELYWRKPELKGRDKPRFGSEAPIAATVSATTETAT
jgi:hypothetical protein